MNDPIFQPTRASPPLKFTPLTKAASRPHSIDISIISSSTVVGPELLNLSRQDIDFIDAVVERAGPVSTTFPIVFKAYNAVLKERGMDSGEVRYYSKLLKLGTMKGKNWGEKWEAVKRQQDHMSSANDDQETVSSRVKPRSKSVMRPSEAGIPQLQDIDADTIGSDLDDDDDDDVPQYHQTFHLISSKQQHTLKPLAAQEPHPRMAVLSSLRGMSSSMRPRPVASELFISDTDDSMPPTVAHSYNAAPHQRRLRQSHVVPLGNVTNIIESPHNMGNGDRVAVARKAVAQAKENRRRVLDDDDVWNAIRVQQLEEEADRYREEKLLERCWEVWKQGHQWIMMTTEQIDEARNLFVFRLVLHHWRNLLGSRRLMYQDVVAFDNSRRLRAAVMAWRNKLRRKQQAKWRNNMRNKMKMVKDRQNFRILENAWILWRRMNQLRLANHHRDHQILLRVFLRWKEGLRRIDTIETRADQFFILKGQKNLLQFWQRWRSMTGLVGVESEMIQRVEARIMWNVWSSWRKRTFDNRRALYFLDRSLQKRALVAWKNARQKVHALEARADKHAARQDRILACAVLRVWVAHVRGREVERQSDKRRFLQAWSTWKNHITRLKKQEDLAAVFHRDTSTRVLLTSLSQWQKGCGSHRSTYNAAVRHHDNQVCYRIWSVWFSRFRERVEERTQHKFVKKLQDRQAARILYRWLILTRQKRRCEQMEILVCERVRQRIGRNALAHWTKRVIFMRECELHAIERYHRRLERDAWERLKSVRARHRENTKLLDDHLLLKQEDILRRLFHRWLAATRVTQHRRYILQGREDQIKVVILQKAWEKWRDHYLELQLRPLEYEMLIRTQQNLLYQALSVWHAKAKTKPAIMAIKFYTARCKKKFYERWREAIPIARKARRAREANDNGILFRTLDKWVQAYRTKLALKAVARARYLRLPTMMARGTSTAIISLPSSSVSPSNSMPALLMSHPNRKPPLPRHTMPEQPTQDNQELATAGGHSRSSRLSRSPFGSGQGTGIVSLLRTNVDQEGRSDLSPPRPRYQYPHFKRRGFSPGQSDIRDAGGATLFSTVNAESTPPSRAPRSTVSDDAGGRTPLWNQLRDVGRLGTALSVASRISYSASSSP